MQLIRRTCEVFNCSYQELVRGGDEVFQMMAILREAGEL